MMLFDFPITDFNGSIQIPNVDQNGWNQIPNVDTDSVHTLGGSTGATLAMAWSPDGSKILMGGLVSREVFRSGSYLS